MNQPDITKPIKLSELRAFVSERKALLGMDTPEWEEGMRNRGENRTPEKRELLERIRKRCKEAGVEPLKAYY